jgi:Zn-dependent protease
MALTRENMKNYVRAKRLNVFGAPVFLHWSVLVVVGGCLAMAASDPVVAIVAVASYFSVILVHELGHAVVAWKLGCEIGSIKLSVIHGECIYEGSHVTARDAALIAWGGPLAQFAVAAVVWTLSFIPTVGESDLFGPLLVFLGYLGPLVAVINLAPRSDMDGTVAWPLIPMLWRDFQARKKKPRSRTKFKVVK